MLHFYQSWEQYRKKSLKLLSFSLTHMVRESSFWPFDIERYCVVTHLSKQKQIVFFQSLLKVQGRCPFYLYIKLFIFEYFSSQKYPDQDPISIGYMQKQAKNISDTLPTKLFSTGLQFQKLSFDNNCATAYRFDVLIVTGQAWLFRMKTCFSFK